jgi:hypothetical protein
LAVFPGEPDWDKNLLSRPERFLRSIKLKHPGAFDFHPQSAEIKAPCQEEMEVEGKRSIPQALLLGLLSLRNQPLSRYKCVDQVVIWKASPLIQ